MIYLHASDSCQLTVVAPIPKATISVIDVTVMDTPACFRACPACCSSGSFLSDADRRFHACIITNASSTPRPDDGKK